MSKEYRGDDLYGKYSQPQTIPGEGDNLQQNLNKVDAVAGTFNRTAAALDYHNIINIAVFLLFIVGLILILKYTMGNALSNVWEFIAKPFKKFNAEAEAKTAGEVTKDYAEAESAADALYAKFSWSGDDEDGILSIIRSYVKGAGDWVMLKKAFGTRTDSKMFGIGSHEHELEGMLSCNLSDSELAPIRSYLRGYGITPNF